MNGYCWRTIWLHSAAEGSSLLLLFRAPVVFFEFFGGVRSTLVSFYRSSLAVLSPCLETFTVVDSCFGGCGCPPPWLVFLTLFFVVVVAVTCPLCLWLLFLLLLDCLELEVSFCTCLNSCLLTIVGGLIAAWPCMNDYDGFLTLHFSAVLVSLLRFWSHCPYSYSPLVTTALLLDLSKLAACFWWLWATFSR